MKRQIKRNKNKSQQTKSKMIKPNQGHTLKLYSKHENTQESRTQAAQEPGSTKTETIVWNLYTKVCCVYSKHVQVSVCSFKLNWQISELSCMQGKLESKSKQAEHLMLTCLSNEKLLPFTEMYIFDQNFQPEQQITWHHAPPCVKVQISWLLDMYDEWLILPWFTKRALEKFSFTHLYREESLNTWGALPGH